MKSGGDGANTTKAFMADEVTFTKVIYREMIHFLMSLNLLKAYVYFLTSMNSALKLLGSLRLFFNEHELYAKTAPPCVYFLTSMNDFAKTCSNIPVIR